MCDVSGLDQDTACILTRMPEANVKHQPHRLLLLFPGEIRPKLVESEAFLIGLIGISTLHRYDYNLMAIRQLHVVVLTGLATNPMLMGAGRKCKALILHFKSYMQSSQSALPNNT